MLARTLSVFAIGLVALLFVCDLQARGSRPDTIVFGADMNAEPLTTLQTQQPSGGATPSQTPSQGKTKDSGKSKDATKSKDAKGRGGKGFGGFGPGGKGGFGKGFGKGGFGKGDFKKKDEPKKDEPKKDEPMKSTGKGPAFGGKLDPETIKTKYEFYKKLYEESQKEAASASVEARIDRLINELQALRKEVRGKKK